ncbi:MAG: hypothetical protein VB101_06090 [Rhodospirillaceae bacterium]|nr:hypothetical protein [Rhodospirillaceae bacterium]
MRSTIIVGVVNIFVISVALSGCNSSRIETYGEIDYSDKSVTVPPGNGYMVGELKKRLRDSGWKLVVDGGPRRIQGSVGDKINIDSYNTFHTRYRLLVDASWFDVCFNGSPAVKYNLSFIDNKTGEEVLAQSGRDCENRASDKFMSFIEKGHQ